MFAECLIDKTKLMEVANLTVPISDNQPVCIQHPEVLLKNLVRFYSHNLCLICAHINT